MKKTTVALLVMGLLIMAFKTKAQGGVIIGTEGTYLFSPINAPAVNVKLGYMNNDENENGAIGIYLNFQPTISRRADVVHIAGVHICYNFYGIRPNIGLDYHIQSTDRAQTLSGWNFAWGLTKYFKNKPYTISAGMSGKYIQVGIGFFAVR